MGDSVYFETTAGEMDKFSILWIKTLKKWTCHIHYNKNGVEYDLEFSYILSTCNLYHTVNHCTTTESPILDHVFVKIADFILPILIFFNFISLWEILI